MAKNWTFAEAMTAIASNDKPAVMDIGRRMPVLMNLATRIFAGDSDAAAEMFNVFPERISAGLINKALSEGVNPIGDDYAVGGKTRPAAKAAAAPAAAPAAKAAPAKAAPAAGKVKLTEKESAALAKAKDKLKARDYDGLSTYALYVGCKARGIAVKTNIGKDGFIAALEAADKAAGEAAPAAAKGKGVNPAKAAYDKCVKAGIKVPTGKDVAFYEKALAKAAPKKPAKKAEAEEESWDAEGESADEEDWNL